MSKRKEWFQCHKESNWQVRQYRLCQKEKEQSHLSKSPDHEVRESQGERQPHFGERKGDQSGSTERKGGIHSEGRQVPRRRGRAGKKSLPKRSRRKDERVSGRKSSPGRSAVSWFYSKPGQTYNGKGDWETKGPLIRGNSKMGQGDS